MRRSHFYGRRNRIFYKAFVIVILLIISLIIADTVLRPQIRALAAMRAFAVAEQSVNSAVLSVLNSGDFKNLVTVEKDSNGKISAVKTDVLKINLMKAGISSATAGVLSGTEQTVYIPSLSLTRLDILSGRGPKIPVKVSFSGYSSSDISSEFDGAGVNQTVHRLYLTVNTTVYISLPSSKETKSLSYKVCIAETVIVGEVPMLFSNTEQR